MDWNGMKWNGMNVFFSAQYRMILQNGCAQKSEKIKWGVLKRGPGGLMNALQRTVTLYICYDLFPFWFVTTSWRPVKKHCLHSLQPRASTTIAGIVSSKGTLSSSDLCSSLSFYKKQLKKTHRISKEQDPVQASSPTSTQRRPIMSTDQPYLKHNLHVKILRNEKDFISGSCMMTRDCRVPTSRAPGIHKIACKVTVSKHQSASFKVHRFFSNSNPGGKDATHRMWKKPGGPLIETTKKLHGTVLSRASKGPTSLMIKLYRQYTDMSPWKYGKHMPLETTLITLTRIQIYSMENPEIYSVLLQQWNSQRLAWFVLKASILMSIWRIQKFQSEIQITRKFSGMMFVFVKTKLHTWRESCQGHSWDLMHFTVKGRGSFKIMLSKKQGSNAEKEIGNINWMACQNFRSCKSCKKWAVV